MSICKLDVSYVTSVTFSFPKCQHCYRVVICTLYRFNHLRLMYLRLEFCKNSNKMTLLIYTLPMCYYLHVTQCWKVSHWQMCSRWYIKSQSIEIRSNDENPWVIHNMSWNIHKCIIPFEIIFNIFKLKKIHFWLQ